MIRMIVLILSTLLVVFVPGLSGGGNPKVKLWPDNTVPYEFDSSFYRDQDRKTFYKAIEAIQEKTCIKFKPRSSEKYFTKIIRKCAPGASPIKPCFGGGSVNNLGGAATNRRLKVGNKHLNSRKTRDVGFMIHELLHVLGIDHTQKRPDRDSVIKINKQNIKDNNIAKQQYKIRPNLNTFGTKYDCRSIMHYRDRAWGNGKGPTMVPANKSIECDLKTANSHLTEADIDLINAMYKCKAEPAKACCRTVEVTHRGRIEDSYGTLNIAGYIF